MIDELQDLESRQANGSAGNDFTASGRRSKILIEVIEDPEVVGYTAHRVRSGSCNSVMVSASDCLGPFVERSFDAAEDCPGQHVDYSMTGWITHEPSDWAHCQWPSSNIGGSLVQQADVTAGSRSSIVSDADVYQKRLAIALGRPDAGTGCAAFRRADQTIWMLRVSRLSAGEQARLLIESLMPHAFGSS